MKFSWADTLNTVARHLGSEPESVTRIADKSGINRTKVREALGVLQRDGIAIEMSAGWVHASMKFGRESKEEEFARRVREHPLLGSAEELLKATMLQFLEHADEPSIAFSDEMRVACAAYVKATLGSHMRKEE